MFLRGICRRFTGHVQGALTVRRGLLRYREALKARFVTPFGECLHRNPEVKDDKVIGYHGEDYDAWKEQAEKVHGCAREGGLFVGPVSVVAQYAKMHGNPVILQVYPSSMKSLS